MPLVSIIIPVYNAQYTISKSLESLLQQTYTELELIFIDDASQDGSAEIIKRYISKFENRGMIAQMISHTENKGVASARNTGLNHATGEYIYYVDADDEIENNTVKKLINRAIDINADIVGCNWFLTFNNNERKMSQPSFSTPLEAIRLMLAGKMRWNLWLFLVKRELYNNHSIRFLPGMNMGEDLMVMIKLFCHAERVTYLNEALYHYGQQNEQSLTKIYNAGHIKQVSANVTEVENYLKQSNYSSQIEHGIDFLKLNIKLPLLISDQKSQYLTWLKWYPESNSKVMLNKDLPLRTRVLQQLAVYKQFNLIKLYYYLVVKFIYGVVYK